MRKIIFLSVLSLGILGLSSHTVLNAHQEVPNELLLLKVAADPGPGPTLSPLLVNATMGIRYNLAHDVGPEPDVISNKVAIDVGPKPDISISNLFAHEEGPQPSNVKVAIVIGPGPDLLAVEDGPGPTLIANHLV